MTLFLCLKFHDEPDEDLTVQDRGLIKIKELLGEDAPVGGQMACAMYMEEAPSVEALTEVFEPVALKFERFGRRVRSRALERGGGLREEARPAGVRASPLSASVDSCGVRDVPSSTPVGCATCPRLLRFHKIAIREGYMWEVYFTKPNYSFSMKDHVKETVDKESTLDEVLNRLTNEELPVTRPQWRFDLVRCKDGEATLLRLNHVLGDGLRMLKLAKRIVEFEDGTPAAIPAMEKMAKNKGAISDDAPTKWSIFKDLCAALTLDKIPKESCSIFHEAPGKILGNDPANPRKHVVSDTVALGDVLYIKNALQPCTVNDVILTAFCAAARRYAADLGDESGAKAICRALIAVSMPDDPERLDWETYNDFVMPSTKLPVFGHDGDTASRFAAVQAAMKSVKKSRAGYIQAVLVAILEKFGLDKVAGATQKKIFAKHSFVYSNLPGYDQPVFLAKKQITKWGIFFPNMITQIIFFSYNGKLSLSISTDDKVLKNPTRLNDLFQAEIEAWKADLEKKQA